MRWPRTCNIPFVAPPIVFLLVRIIIAIIIFPSAIARRFAVIKLDRLDRLNMLDIGSRMMWRRNRRGRIIIILLTVVRTIVRWVVMRGMTEYTLRIACDVGRARRVKNFTEKVECKEREENGKCWTT
jgi:hypothetical protein